MFNEEHNQGILELLKDMANCLVQPPCSHRWGKSMQRWHLCPEFGQRVGGIGTRATQVWPGPSTSLLLCCRTLAVTQQRLGGQLGEGELDWARDAQEILEVCGFGTQSADRASLFSEEGVWRAWALWRPPFAPSCPSTSLVATELGDSLA